MLDETDPLNTCFHFSFAVYIGTFGFTLNPYGHKVLVKLGPHQSQAAQDLIASNTSLLFKPSIQTLGGELPMTPTSAKPDNKENDEEPVQNGEATQNGGVARNGHMKKEINDTCEESHCTLSPDSVRYEAECLRTDFNLRIKQVIFNSVVSAYYVGFIPVKFTQVSVLPFNVKFSCPRLTSVVPCSRSQNNATFDILFIRP